MKEKLTPWEKAEDKNALSGLSDLIARMKRRGAFISVTGGRNAGKTHLHSLLKSNLFLNHK